MIPRSVAFDAMPCPCSANHDPKPPWVHVHHIHPMEYGGADVTENEAPACPATHDQVHVILRASKKAGALVPRPLGFKLYAYALARRGWEAMQRG